MRSPDLSGKRLQLLKEIVPKVRRVGILWNPTNDGSAISWRNSESMAPLIMALELRSLQVQRPSDFDSAFKSLSEDRFDAFSVLRDAKAGPAKNFLPELSTTGASASTGLLSPSTAWVSRQLSWKVSYSATSAAPLPAPSSVREAK
jgi:ABC-type uncharacterized transport system substrate-binding protein